MARAVRGASAQRGAVMVLLTYKAGLRACEVSRLTWQMVCAANRKIGSHIELPAKAAKKGAVAASPSMPSCVRRFTDCVPGLTCAMAQLSCRVEVRQ